MKQIYKTVEIPVISGVLDGQGRSLGIIRKYTDSDDAYFALYDIASDNVVCWLDRTSAEFGAPDEGVDLPGGISCKGALITGDFINYYDDDTDGYKLTLYDLATYEKICCIEISEYFGDEWLLKYRVADAVCIDNRKVIIAAYNDSEYIGAAIELFTYYIDTDEFFSIGIYGAEDSVLDNDMGYLYDVQIARDGSGFTCRRANEFDNIQSPSYNNLWEVLEFTIDKELQYFDFSERDRMNPSIEEFYDIYNRCLAIKWRHGTILSDGYIKCGDIASRNVLIDEGIDRNDSYESRFIPELQLFFVHIIRDDRDTTAYILGYDDENWINVGRWTVSGDHFFTLRYDEAAQVAILENDLNSFLISRVD